MKLHINYDCHCQSHYRHFAEYHPPFWHSYALTTTLGPFAPKLPEDLLSFSAGEETDDVVSMSNKMHLVSFDARSPLRAPPHFGGNAGRWHVSYKDELVPMKTIYNPVVPAALAGFFVSLLGTEARVWGRALAEHFSGVPVLDAELVEVHMAVQQTVLDNNLEPLLRWALWIIEFSHIAALGIPPVVNLAAPPGNWCDIYYYPSNNVAELLEAKDFHVMVLGFALRYTSATRRTCHSLCSVHAVAFFELSSVVAGPQVIFRAWPLTFGTVPSFVALPPAGRSVPTLFSVLLPWHIAPFLSSPKGSGN